MSRNSRVCLVLLVPLALGAHTTRASAQEPQAVVKPVFEGPLHEAFLSPVPRADSEPRDKAPPPPIVERPGVDRPDPDARWIGGYWDWDRNKDEYLWVTGTWRVPPPGRFWVDGYWKRTDQGWIRVPGFWSERQTDRLDYKKDGPPADHPDDDPGAAPAVESFYVPGVYVPDGDGVKWRSGFWTRAYKDWAWVPAHWLHQPEGWAFVEGFWDYTLEGRGTLFSPAKVEGGAGQASALAYDPVSQISPDSYGRLLGAYGRSNTYYDGYPGVFYDDSGLFYGYGDYGNLDTYTGYYDYPYLGAGTTYSLGGSGYGLGMMNGMGAGLGLLGMGYGMGYGTSWMNPYMYMNPWWGMGGWGLGMGGWGMGGWGMGGWGLGMGWGYPWWGMGGWGLGGWGLGGWGLGGWGWGNRQFCNTGVGPGRGGAPFFPTNPRGVGSRNGLVNGGAGVGRGGVGLGLGTGGGLGRGLTGGSVGGPIANGHLARTSFANPRGVSGGTAHNVTSGPAAGFPRGNPLARGSGSNTNHLGVPAGHLGSYNAGLGRSATTHTVSRPIMNSTGHSTGLGASPLGRAGATALGNHAAAGLGAGRPAAGISRGLNPSANPGMLGPGRSALSGGNPLANGNFGGLNHAGAPGNVGRVPVAGGATSPLNLGGLERSGGVNGLGRNGLSGAGRPGGGYVPGMSSFPQAGRSSMPSIGNGSIGRGGLGSYGGMSSPSAPWGGGMSMSPGVGSRSLGTFGGGNRGFGGSSYGGFGGGRGGFGGGMGGFGGGRGGFGGGMGGGMGGFGGGHGGGGGGHR